VTTLLAGERGDTPPHGAPQGEQGGFEGATRRTARTIGRRTVDAANGRKNSLGATQANRGAQAGTNVVTQNRTRGDKTRGVTESSFTGPSTSTREIVPPTAPPSTGREETLHSTESEQEKKPTAGRPRFYRGPPETPAVGGPRQEQGENAPKLPPEDKQ